VHGANARPRGRYGGGCVGVPARIREKEVERQDPRAWARMKLASGGAVRLGAVPVHRSADVRTPPPENGLPVGYENPIITQLLHIH
jgi:hypothetical protein